MPRKARISRDRFRIFRDRDVPVIAGDAPAFGVEDVFGLTGRVRS